MADDRNDDYGFDRYRTDGFDDLDDNHVDITVQEHDNPPYMTHQSDDIQDNNEQEDYEEDNISSNESTSSNIIFTPNGSTSWIPNIPEHLKISIGMEFMNKEAAFNAYEKYAKICGFSVRKSSSKLYNDRSIKRKYFLCNKAGKPIKRIVDTIEAKGLQRKKRNPTFKVTDCKALVIFKRDQISGVYVVEHIKEAHNHPLNLVNEERMSRRKRRLKFSDQQFVVQAATTGVGPSRAHTLSASMKGGYDIIEPRRTDYKNFWRDFNIQVGVNDAQCIVDEMNYRKANFPNFTFEYRLDGHELCGMFWADEVAKAYYKEFSDVISFDATFRSNKYDMIFIPFTTIDHHKKTVNVGAALMANETIESYVWLLKAFLKAHGAQPRLVLSDQGPAMKQAIALVFTESTHRLCMWHIMSKLRLKISPTLLNDTDFKKRINKLVWNVFLEPSEFEEGWNALMDQYRLKDHIWLASMYQIRETWIPAFFKHIPNCGLMKTTSRSESSNSFFNTFSRHGNLLVNFMMNFDTAIVKQRIDQRSLDDMSTNTQPGLITDTAVEIHASKVYTRSVFLEVQKEIKKATSKCFQVQVEDSSEIEIFTISYRSKKKSGIKIYHKVEYTKAGHGFKCTCDNFKHFGLLCCHIFRVILNYDIQETPSQYVLRRWRKNLISEEYQRTRHGWAQKDSKTTELVREAQSIQDHCIDKYVTYTNLLQDFVEKLRLLKDECDNHFINKSDKRSNDDTFKALLGITIPENIEIHVPTGIRNKGCRTSKRMVGAAEKASKTAEKKARSCSGCGKMVRGHNWRSCPVRKASTAEGNS